MTDLDALREAVGKVAGPDRKIDRDLFWAFERGRATTAFWNASTGRPGPLPDKLPEGLGKLGVEVASPEYTASIDAALALVERKWPGATFMLDNRVVDWKVDHGRCRVRLYRPGLIAATFDPPVVPGSHAEAFGWTAPLAILNALLAALASSDPLVGLTAATATAGEQQDDAKNG